MATWIWFHYGHFWRNYPVIRRFNCTISRHGAISFFICQSSRWLQWGWRHATCLWCRSFGIYMGKYLFRRKRTRYKSTWRCSLMSWQKTRGMAMAQNPARCWRCGKGNRSESGSYWAKKFRVSCFNYWHKWSHDYLQSVKTLLLFSSSSSNLTCTSWVSSRQSEILPGSFHFWR